MIDKKNRMCITNDNRILIISSGYSSRTLCISTQDKDGDYSDLTEYYTHPDINLRFKQIEFSKNDFSLFVYEYIFPLFIILS